MVEKEKCGNKLVWRVEKEGWGGLLEYRGGILGLLLS